MFSSDPSCLATLLNSSPSAYAIRHLSGSPHHILPSLPSPLKLMSFIIPPVKNLHWETSLEIQWLRILLPVPGTRVWSLVRELRPQNATRNSACALHWRPSVTKKKFFLNLHLLPRPDRKIPSSLTCDWRTWVISSQLISILSALLP